MRSRTNDYAALENPLELTLLLLAKRCCSTIARRAVCRCGCRPYAGGALRVRSARQPSEGKSATESIRSTNSVSSISSAARLRWPRRGVTRCSGFAARSTSNCRSASSQISISRLAGIPCASHRARARSSISDRVGKGEGLMERRIDLGARRGTSATARRAVRLLRKSPSCALVVYLSAPVATAIASGDGELIELPLLRQPTPRQCGRAPWRRAADRVGRGRTRFGGSCDGGGARERHVP